MTMSTARRALAGAGLSVALLAAVAPAATLAHKPAGFGNNSYPGQFTVIGSRVWFNAADAKGFEPWITDGTAAGTHRVKDLEPGADSSQIRWFVPLGRKVLMAATTTAQGMELWISNGTAAGTHVAKDIHPGNESSLVEYTIAAYNGSAYFPAYSSSTSGIELWKSDGTDAGTTRVGSSREA